MGSGGVDGAELPGVTRRWMEKADKTLPLFIYLKDLYLAFLGSILPNQGSTQPPPLLDELTLGTSIALLLVPLVIATICKMCFSLF